MSPGNMRTGVFRKDTQTDQTLAFISHHARATKKMVVRALLDRVETHFSERDIEGRAGEIVYVKEILARNGYL